MIYTRYKMRQVQGYRCHNGRQVTGVLALKSLPLGRAVRVGAGARALCPTGHSHASGMAPSAPESRITSKHHWHNPMFASCALK